VLMIVDNLSKTKKSEQLGMNYSTAQNRLRKKILFMMIQKLKLDECFQCKTLIVESQDLSIEHKIPWLDGDTRLFWDLDNIAFSHISCNASASRYSTRKKYTHKIEDRENEKGHYPSRTWYDRGCRCHSCKEIKRLSKRKHEKDVEFLKEE